ncbi:type IV pilin [archaeon]|nr:type IV pilin [archaeon]
MKKVNKKGFGKSVQYFHKGKKGVSPVVATVLLVALMLILAAIIFAWARGFVKEAVEKNGESAEYICDQLKFDANFAAKGFVEKKMTGTIQVVNRGTIPIYGFDIKQVDGGVVKRTPFVFKVAAGETIPAKNIVLEGDAEKLEIFPIILGMVKNQKLNKQYTCLHNAKKIQLN